MECEPNADSRSAKAAGIEGLVTSHRYKGVMVNLITLEDVEQLYPIRIYLEGLAGKLATPTISGAPEKLRALEKFCREMEAL